MSFSKLFQSGASTRNQSHFAILVTTALSDGPLKEAELQILRRLKTKLNISDSSYDKIIENPALYPLTPPNNSEERLQLLHDLFKIAFADHELDPAEHKLLKMYATAIGYNDEDAGYLVKRSIEIFSGALNLEDYRYLLNKDRS
ncbi:MAG: TerB family tellurite resistance protein [Nonlabens sp.]